MHTHTYTFGVEHKTISIGKVGFDLVKCYTASWWPRRAYWKEQHNETNCSIIHSLQSNYVITPDVAKLKHWTVSSLKRISINVLMMHTPNVHVYRWYRMRGSVSLCTNVTSLTLFKVHLLSVLTSTRTICVLWWCNVEENINMCVILYVSIKSRHVNNYLCLRVSYFCVIYLYYFLIQMIFFEYFSYLPFFILSQFFWECFYLFFFHHVFFPSNIFAFLITWSLILYHIIIFWC